VWTERFFTERNFRVLAAVEEAAAELGKTPAQIALAWVLGVSGMTAVIIGARTLDHLQMNLSAGGWDFPPDLWKKLDEASAIPLEYPQDFHAFVEPLIHGDVTR
jgi:aryl-alcohol dehydrogenase-like predicted oxidoreductase